MIMIKSTWGQTQHRKIWKTHKDSKFKFFFVSFNMTTCGSNLVSNLAWTFQRITGGKFSTGSYLLLWYKCGKINVNYCNVPRWRVSSPTVRAQRRWTIRRLKHSRKIVFDQYSTNKKRLEGLLCNFVVFSRVAHVAINPRQWQGFVYTYRPRYRFCERHLSPYRRTLWQLKWVCNPSGPRRCPPPLAQC